MLSPQSGSHGAPRSGEPARKTRDELVAKPPILSYSYLIRFLSYFYSYHALVLLSHHFGQFMLQ